MFERLRRELRPRPTVVAAGLAGLLLGAWGPSGAGVLLVGGLLLLLTVPWLAARPGPDDPRTLVWGPQAPHVAWSGAGAVLVGLVRLVA